MPGIDWREFYPIFTDLGQEPVTWLRMRPCPNMDPNNQRHVKDCPVCDGNGEYLEDTVSVTAPIIDGFKLDKKLAQLGEFLEGDAMLGIASTQPDGAGGWADNPLMEIRPHDRIIARNHKIRADGESRDALEWAIQWMECDTGTTLVKVWSVDNNVLTNWVIGTDVELDSTNKKLNWLTGGPDADIVFLDVLRPARYVVLGDVGAPIGSGTFGVSDTEGPRVIHLRLADMWERAHGK